MRGELARSRSMSLDRHHGIGIEQQDIARRVVAARKRVVDAGAESEIAAGVEIAPPSRSTSSRVCGQRRVVDDDERILPASGVERVGQLIGFAVGHDDDVETGRRSAAVRRRPSRRELCIPSATASQV